MRRWMRIVLVGGLLAGACGGSAEGDEGNGLGVFEMQVGDCFSNLAAEDGTGEVAEVAEVLCEASHENEVFAIFQIEDAPEYPSDEVAAIADEGCRSRFEGYVSTSYESSKWFAGNLYPSKDTWEQIDDREVICYLFAQDGEVIGSARGSGE